MYIILKPESRGHIKTIEDLIIKEGFDIISRHPIKKWDRLASRLYSPQINKDVVFAGEIESYLWLTNHFFGNNAAALVVNRDAPIEDNLNLMSDLKIKIRRAINSNDQYLKIFLNLDKLDNERKYPIGIIGCLGVESKGKINIAEKGRWDYFYFKYIHIPDPNLEDYKREFKILMEEGILDIKISPSKWELMRKMQTFVYLKEG